MGINFNIELDYDDVALSCTRYDRKILLRELVDRMDDVDIQDVINTVKDEELKAKLVYFVMPSSNGQTIMEQDFHNSLLAISRVYLQVTPEEEQIINNIAKRFK